MNSETYNPCPPEVAEPLLIILRESILLIRMAGNADDADWCATEANHIHNLPGLIRWYSRDRLKRYLAWAQTEYAAEFQDRFDRLPITYIPQWERLELFLKNTDSE